MLKAINLELKLPDNRKVNYSMGSIMQGVLMEIVSANIAEELHKIEIRPYTQHIYFDKATGKNIWRITALNKYAVKNILDKVLEFDEVIHLKQKKYDISIISKSIEQEITYKGLVEKIFLSEELIRKYELEFLTTTAFKSQGEYQITPEIRWILQSLINRWNLFSSEISLDEKGLLEELAKQVFLKKYNLHSEVFGLENTRIQGFRGNAVFACNGPKNLRNLIAILFTYANYAGIGIKTAMGMGGVKSKIS